VGGAGRVPGKLKRSYTLRISYAVLESNLPPHLRHFLLTLATLANSKTGQAYYGQEALARALGCTDRQVRKNFDAIEERRTRGETPVWVERKHRGASDGKGRTSDVWRLVLQREVRSGIGTGGPVNDPARADDQPELSSTPTGTLTHPNRNSSSRDLRSDRRSDRSTPEPEALLAQPANEIEFGPGLHSPGALSQLAWDAMVDDATARPRRR
jgi:hypothetical protein